MIDINKYEEMGCTTATVNDYAIAVEELLAEVLRLREAWRILRSKTEMSCVCFNEYPDKQDMNTHELMDLAMKEASE